MMNLLQRLKAKVVIMKNSRDRKGRTFKGRSARNGNAASPYSKYNKSPYRYSPDYYEWRASVARKVVNANNKYAEQAGRM